MHINRRKNFVNDIYVNYMYVTNAYVNENVKIIEKKCIYVNCKS